MVRFHQEVVTWFEQHMSLFIANRNEEDSQVDAHTLYREMMSDRVLSYTGLGRSAAQVLLNKIVKEKCEVSSKNNTLRIKFIDMARKNASSSLMVLCCALKLIVLARRSNRQFYAPGGYGAKSAIERLNRHHRIL